MCCIDLCLADVTGLCYSQPRPVEELTPATTAAAYDLQPSADPDSATVAGAGAKELGRASGHQAVTGLIRCILTGN